MYKQQSDDQYMFFGFEGEQTGVGFIQPCQATYQFAQQMLLGYTSYNFFQFDDQVLDPLRVQFIGNSYDLLSNNCNHFSRRLARELRLDQKIPNKIFRTTDCCNLLRCCIPRCILNGRLDWFNWQVSSIQNSGYYQLQQLVQEQFNIKMIKQNKQKYHQPQENKVHQGRQSSRIKYVQPTPQIMKHSTLRRGTLPHTQNAHQRLSIQRNSHSRESNFQIQRQTLKKQVTKKYPRQDISMFISQKAKGVRYQT